MPSTIRVEAEVNITKIIQSLEFNEIVTLIKDMIAGLSQQDKDILIVNISRAELSNSAKADLIALLRNDLNLNRV